MSTPPPPHAPTAPAEQGATTADHLKSTAKHGTIYSIGVILSRLIGFVMIPLYTRVLTPADYGVLEILSLTTDVVSMLAGFGIGLAVIRSLYQYDRVEDQRAVASSAAILLASVFGVAATVGLVLGGPLARVLLGPEAVDGPALLRLAVLGMFFGSTIEVPLALLRARQRSTEVVAVGLVRLLLSVSLNILLVVVLRLGVAGVLWSTLLTTGLVGGYLFWRLLRENGTEFSPRIVRNLVAFGAPLVIWNLASFVMHYSDRYFLRVYVSFDAVGLYSLSYKLAMLLSLLVSGPFSDVWVPKSLELERTEGEASRPILRTILRYYNLVLVTVGLGIALFAGDVIRLVTGKDFHTAAAAVPLLVPAMIFFGYRAVSQMGAMIRGRSDLIAASTTVAAVSVIGLNFLMIPRWGVLGAAGATLIAFVIEFIVMRRLTEKVYPHVIGFGTLLVPIALGAGAWFAAESATPQGAPLVVSLALKTVAFGLYVVGLGATGALGRPERAFLYGMLRDPRGAVARLKGR